jgi:hypothetical protein
MSLAHFIYIPAVVLVGIVIGYILGGRAAEASRAEKADKDRRRDARRARRERGQPRAEP